MLEAIRINNYKKFSDFGLTDLSKINIIIGINNVGKTTLLEAILGFASGCNISALMNLSVLHRTYSEQAVTNPYRLAEGIWHAFHKNKNSEDFNFSFEGIADGKKIYIKHRFHPHSIFSQFLPNEMGIFNETNHLKEKGDTQMLLGQNSGIDVPYPRTSLGRWTIETDDKKHEYDIAFPTMTTSIISEKPLILAKFNDILAHRNDQDNRITYSALARAGLLSKMVDSFNDAFKGIGLKDIENIPYPDGSAAPISVRFNDGRVLPLYSLGDGLRRWFNIIGSMVVYKRSIHCIEEIDATLHHAAQKNVSYKLCSYVKEYGNQLFITTHNLEYLNSFLYSVKEADDNLISLRDDIRIITLRDVNGLVESRVLDGAAALSALENGLELRI